jgi:hypothetical protein
MLTSSAPQHPYGARAGGHQAGPHGEPPLDTGPRCGASRVRAGEHAGPSPGPRGAQPLAVAAPYGITRDA